MIDDLPPSPDEIAQEITKRQEEENIVTFAQIKEVFEQAMPSREAAPLDEQDVKRRIEEANRELENEGFTATDLLHSAVIVFEQQRYYEVSKLFFYTESVYDNLCKVIVDSTAVSQGIKNALGPFSDVGFPKTISIDEPTKSIKISLYDKKTYIKIVIDISYFSGKNLAFISHFQY